MGKYCFGVDIGGTTIKMGLFTAEGELLDKWEIPTRRENGGEKVPQDIADAIAGKCTEKNIEKTDITGVGIGVPGPVRSDGTVMKCANLGWGIFNVNEKMSELTGLKCQALNDANAAALGELWRGSGKGFKNLVFITLGTGVKENRRYSRRWRRDRAYRGQSYRGCYMRLWRSRTLRAVCFGYRYCTSCKEGSREQGCRNSSSRQGELNL